MASRSFYLVSTALLGGTALLLWLALAGGSDPAGGPEVTSAPAGAGVDDRALGVRAADHDSARAEIPEQTATVRAGRSTTPRISLGPPDLSPEEPAPAGPLLAGSPEMNALSEASAAAQPRVIAAVRADLERRRGELRKSCWPPGSDVAAAFTVQASYAADGTLVTLGVPDVDGMPDVGSCLMRQIAQKPPALPEPPGVAVEIAVDLAFPGSQPLPPPPSPSSVRAESP
jgi:hypothetical protein